MKKISSRIDKGRVPQYSIISFVVFLCCLCILLILLINAEKLTALGLTAHFYYIVLVLMGLAAAGFLFGVLPSTANYESVLHGGTLKLSGAIVGAALVVVGGYFFVPKATTYGLTVYVHGRGGLQDVVLRNSGRVILELGPDPRSEPIGENGQAYFPAVPTSFRGQLIPAWVDSDSYESAEPQAEQRLTGATLYLLVRKKTLHYILKGLISDTSGNPLPGVRVVLPEFTLEGKTNRDGMFELRVLAEDQRMVELVAELPGYQTKHLNPTLGDPGINFSLERIR